MDGEIEWRLNEEIGWRDRMKDERHIVNTSCPGHIPYKPNQTVVFAVYIL